MSLTVGSLFAGIGGFDLGFERAGFEIKWQVEIDPFCRKVLEKHWPHVRRYEDVRTVGAELERVDVICGGFPCQDISQAGRGEGIDGERSGLWGEMARILCELRPLYAVMENVPRLLAGGSGSWFGRVLGELAEGGFDAEWDCLPASAFGAPHERDRVWLVAYPTSRRMESQRVSTEGRSCVADTHRRGSVVADADSRDSYRRCGVLQVGWQRIAEEATRNVGGGGAEWRAEPDVGRVAHGIPNRVDRLKGLGNAVVPQIAQWIAERIKEAEGVSGRSQVSR